MAENEGERRWIIEPPGPEEIALHLAVGGNTRLTAEQEAAVGALLRTLEAADPEVTGHALAAGCPKEGSCGTFTCTTVECGNLKCGTLKAVTGTGTGWNLTGTFGGMR